MASQVDIRVRLATLCLKLQHDHWERSGTDGQTDGEESGSLAQVWLPETCGSTGKLILKTKGLPYCIAGTGDLLALFRCISCRYVFGTDVENPQLLGAPGRVFTLREPEMSRNVQKYSKEIYLRAAEAEQCKVHCTLVLPLFGSPDRTQVLACLEVTQAEEDMQFGTVTDVLEGVLAQCGLFTTPKSQGIKPMKVTDELSGDPVAQNSEQTSNSREMGSSQSQEAGTAQRGGCAAAAALLQHQVSGEGMDENLERQHSTDAAAVQAPAFLAPGEEGSRHGAKGLGMYAEAPALQLQIQKNREVAKQAAALAPVEVLQNGLNQAQEAEHEAPLGARMTSLDGGEEDMGSIKDEDEDDDDDTGDDYSDDEGGSNGVLSRKQQFRRRGKGTGNPGKPGKKLRLADLQAQFGVGLKEAAARLGICPTTLKRACRRNGIRRWPRKQLIRMSKAMAAGKDELKATGTSAGATEAANAAIAAAINGGGRRKSTSNGKPVTRSSSGRKRSSDTQAGGNGEHEGFEQSSVRQVQPEPDTRWSALSELLPDVGTNGQSTLLAEKELRAAMGTKTVSGSGGERLGLRGMDSSAPTMTNMTEPPLWTPLSSCSPASASPSLPVLEGAKAGRVPSEGLTNAFGMFLQNELSFAGTGSLDSSWEEERRAQAACHRMPSSQPNLTAELFAARHQQQLAARGSMPNLAAMDIGQARRRPHSNLQPTSSMPISMPGGPRASFPGSASSTYGHAGHGLLAQSLHNHSLHSHSLHSHSGASSNDMLYGAPLPQSAPPTTLLQPLGDMMGDGLPDDSLMEDSLMGLRETDMLDMLLG